MTLNDSRMLAWLKALEQADATDGGSDALKSCATALGQLWRGCKGCGIDPTLLIDDQVLQALVANASVAPEKERNL